MVAEFVTELEPFSMSLVVRRWNSRSGWLLSRSKYMANRPPRGRLVQGLKSTIRWDSCVMRYLWGCGDNTVGHWVRWSIVGTCFPVVLDPFTEEFPSAYTYQFIQQTISPYFLNQTVLWALGWWNFAKSGPTQVWLVQTRWYEGDGIVGAKNSRLAWKRMH